MGYATSTCVCVCLPYSKYILLSRLLFYFTFLPSNKSHFSGYTVNCAWLLLKLGVVCLVCSLDLISSAEARSSHILPEMQMNNASIQLGRNQGKLYFLLSIIDHTAYSQCKRQRCMNNRSFGELSVNLKLKEAFEIIHSRWSLDQVC